MMRMAACNSCCTPSETSNNHGAAQATAHVTAKDTVPHNDKARVPVLAVSFTRL
jgi:hypothetical protein